MFKSETSQVAMVRAECAHLRPLNVRSTLGMNPILKTIKLQLTPQFEVNNAIWTLLNAVCAFDRRSSCRATSNLATFQLAAHASFNNKSCCF